MNNLNITDDKLDKVATKIIAGLTRVEEHFSGKDIVFINVNANDVKDITVTSAPSLVYFKNGEPHVYSGMYYLLTTYYYCCCCC